ncbi:MAG: hypothetical protein B6I25_07250 [Planctomycetales bacterium 4572_13]|nr:MAG: hypothetical protein B6I25_07250 [Planctomycetales bacterium 4572_13]
MSGLKIICENRPNLTSECCLTKRTHFTKVFFGVLAVKKKVYKSAVLFFYRQQPVHRLYLHVSVLIHALLL